MGSARTCSPERFRSLAWAALGAQLAIVVTGAAVRLTASGLGCSDWPGCSDDRLVPAWGFHGWVEFGNRLVTFAVLITAALATVMARRRRPYRARLERLSWGLVIGTVAQALVGGVLVLLELDPRLTVLHFALSLLLVADGVALVHFAGPAPTGELPRRPFGRLPLLVGALQGTLVVVMATGTVVTGSGPHGGDVRAERFSLELPTVTRVHSGALWAYVAGLAFTALVLWRRGAPVRHLQRRVAALAILVGGQATLGYVQYALGVPAGLVALHVAGSLAVFSVGLSLLLAVVAPLRGAPADAEETAATGALRGGGRILSAR